MDNFNDYYSDVASQYDELYDFMYHYLPALAIKYLQLKSGDVLADIGAGTGAITSQIWKEAGDYYSLAHPIICVEPSSEMLQAAATRDGLKLCCATADEFFDSACHASDMPMCNKIVMITCAHLFPDLEGAFRKALTYLPADGVLLLIARSNECTLPMWKSMKEKFSAYDYKMHLVNAGFNVQTIKEVVVTPMAKQEWHDKIRKKIFTTLHEFTDEQIEEGIKELDREWFPGKMNSDEIEVIDSLECFIATKRQ